MLLRLNECEASGVSDERNTSKRSLLHPLRCKHPHQIFSNDAKNCAAKICCVHMENCAQTFASSKQRQQRLALLAATGRKYAALAQQQYTSSRTTRFSLAGRSTQQQRICVHNATPAARSAGKYTTKENTQSHIELTQPLVNKQNTNTPTVWRVSVAHSAAKKAHFTHTN